MALILRTLPLPERLLLVIDDSPTKRYGPKVEGADVHHNPTPGPADQPFSYGHVWVTISLALRHPQWGPLALPLRAMLYVRQQTLASIPQERALAAIRHQAPTGGATGGVARSAAEKSGKNRVDRRRRRLHQASVSASRAENPQAVVVGRLRKDAALRDLPPKPKRGQRRVAADHASTARTSSAWPSEPGNGADGKPSSARSTARRSPRPTRPSWPPMPPPAG